MHLEVRSPFPGHEVVGERITDDKEIRDILNSEYAQYVVRVQAPLVEGE